MKALELDSSLAEPHATPGVVKRDFEWDWSGAERDFSRAVALNPGYAEAYHWHGTLHGMLGRHVEAMVTKTHALSLDPLSVVIRTDLARMLYFARDYDQSIAHYRSAIEMDPTFSTAHLWLGQVFEQKGMFDAAIAEFQTGVQLTGGSSFSLAKLAHGFAIAGSPDRCDSLLRQLLEFPSEKYLSPYDIATICVGLSEYERAFSWLDRAFEERSLWMGYLNVEPQLDPVRSDPRFQHLLQRVGLIPQT